jgi:hypothetical protein
VTLETLLQQIVETPMVIHVPTFGAVLTGLYRAEIYLAWNVLSPFVNTVCPLIKPLISMQPKTAFRLRFKFYGCYLSIPLKFPYPDFLGQVAGAVCTCMKLPCLLSIGGHALNLEQRLHMEYFQRYF